MSNEHLLVLMQMLLRRCSNNKSHVNGKYSVYMQDSNTWVDYINDLGPLDQHNQCKLLQQNE